MPVKMPKSQAIVSKPTLMTEREIKSFVKKLDDKINELKVAQITEDRAAYQRDAQAALASGKITDFMSCMDGPEQQKVEARFTRKISSAKAMKTVLEMVLGKGTVDLDKL